MYVDSPAVSVTYRIFLCLWSMFKAEEMGAIFCFMDVKGYHFNKKSWYV